MGIPILVRQYIYIETAPKCWCFYSSPPKQSGRYFTDDIFRCDFVNAKFCILIKTSLKYVPNVPIENKPALGLDDDLAPNRRKAIIWANGDRIHWRKMRH